MVVADIGHSDRKDAKTLMKITKDKMVKNLQFQKNINFIELSNRAMRSVFH